MKLCLLALVLTVTAGCTSPTQKRAGGITSTVLGALSFSAPKDQSQTSTAPATSGGSTTTTLSAPEDPSTPSSQVVERTDERNTVVPVPVERVTETIKPDGVIVKVTETLVPTPVTLSRTSQKSATMTGVSQVNQGSITSAKLEAWKPVQWLGIVLILGALAAFHPVVFIAIGRNRILQAVCGASGILLIMLPSMVVGNEKLLIYIGFGVVAALVGWFFLHEHGRLQGFVDANHDGIDDREQLTSKRESKQ